MSKVNRIVLKMFTLAVLAPSSAYVFANISVKQQLNNKLNDISTKKYSDKFKLRKFYSENQEYKLPVYEAPYCPFYEKVNYSQAPNFKEISLTKYNSKISDSVIFDSQGWPTIETYRNLTYLQLFLNEDVARYFDDKDNPKEDLVNLESIYDKVCQTKEINLSPNDKYSFYLNDEYADDTIKCLNNPLFYLNINGSIEKTDRSIFSQVDSINLANNNLSFIPFFGYIDLSLSEYFKNDAQKSPITMTDLLINNKDLTLINKENKQVNFKGFNKTDLKTFDFRNNHLINLPMIKSNESCSAWDLSYLFASAKDKEGKILLDGNYFSSKCSYYYKQTLVINKDDELNTTYQTSAVIDYDKLGFELSRYYLNDQLKLNVDPAKIDLGSVNEQLYNYIPDFDKNNRYKPSNIFGNMMCYFITKFINNNYLCSVEICCEFNSSLLEILVTTGGEYMFGLMNYSNSIGQVNICYTNSAAKKTSCKIVIDENNKKTYEYSVNKCTAANGEIITLQYKGYKTCNVNFVIMWVLVILTILFIAWLVFYYSFLKRYLVNKKMLKDKKYTNNMENK